MKTQLFDYPLPEAAIARHPASERDGARLLVMDGDALEDRRIADLPELITEGALVVVNDTRVRRARVFGVRRPGGGRVELLFLEHAARRDAGSGERWQVLGRANKPLAPGTRIDAPGMAIEVVCQLEGGVLEVSVEAALGVEAELEQSGHVPIPPYLDRADEPLDRERYQTVYARRISSVAAPTAGLHLTDELLAQIRAHGARVTSLELSVGLGTFRPVTVEDLDRHPMHAERYEIPDALVEQVQSARSRRAPVVAIGTTVVRALESAADLRGGLRSGVAETRLLIQPGYRFRVVDALLTNFHQPRSTLLALVAAFAGYERTLAAYREAVARGYRFLSYGDAMWIPRRIE